MPYVVHEKCECCYRWDWFLLKIDGKYVCSECKSKKKEFELEAISKAVKLDEGD